MFPKIGRAILCPPALANERTLIHHDGAQGTARPACPYYFLAPGAGFEKDCHCRGKTSPGNQDTKHQETLTKT